MKKLFRFLLHLYYRHMWWKILRIVMKHPNVNPREAYDLVDEIYGDRFDADYIMFFQHTFLKKLSSYSQSEQPQHTDKQQELKT